VKIQCKGAKVQRWKQVGVGVGIGVGVGMLRNEKG
jgi:hypothetical protein